MTARNLFSNPLENLNQQKNKTNTQMSAAARVYEEIKERIISLNMPPDTTLVRRELSEKYNISQAPLRDAIIRLENDGLVISYPQSRTMVTKIDPVRIRDEHFLRIAVECEVVRQIVIKSDLKFITKAKGFVKLQSALVGDIEQVELYKQLDAAFHEALFSSVNQAELYSYLSLHSGHSARLRTLDLPRPEKMLTVLHEHQAIIEAIEQQDIEKSVQKMREHLAGTISRLPQIIANHKNFFA